MIYISEAHATDDRRPVGYAQELGISEHKNYGERCTTAKMLMENKELTIPCLIDGMDNKVNEAYQAQPDRIYVVRTDGKIAIAAAQGPWGFAPALKQTEAWLKELKTSGEQPPLEGADDK